MTEADREWLTTSQAAELLGRTAQTVRNLARDRKLRGYLVGSHWQFLRSDVEAYLQAGCNNAEPRRAS